MLRRVPSRIRLLLFAWCVGCSTENATQVDQDSASQPMESDAASLVVPPVPLSPGDLQSPSYWPDRLSETGLYDDLSTRTVASDILRYEVAWPLWSDGAAKERLLWLPPGKQIDTSDPDRWSFPKGTKAWKHFVVDGVLIETRYIVRLHDGWDWVSYQWRPDGSDADAVPDGVVAADGKQYDIPDQQSCFRCHTSDGFLGFAAIQLGEDSPTQTLSYLSQQGLLSHDIDAPAVVPGEGNTKETLGYLHGNCGGCHSDDYYLAHNYGLRLRVNLGTETPEASNAYTTGINAPTMHVLETSFAIVPGDPEASQVYERMGRRDMMAMPLLGTKVVDEGAMERVHEWISSMEHP